ncbi:hornerin-like [Iris pallida]|uniref:Hornerin-like n=1 Tax=Iris pallida TaxID=29817 RepID=A0AAX6DWW1_IRIPA|nr:hornerin-like [Iris pallida]
MGKGKRKGKGPSVLPPLLAVAPAYPLVAGWLWMPSGPLGLAATPGFFFPLGVLPPPLFSIPPPPWLAGALLAGRIPPCGLSQSFPPPLHPPRRRRPRRRHRARCRAAGPDPPPPEVPLPAPPPPLGPPPGRSRASVDPLRPASLPLAAPLSWPPAPAFTAPQAAPPPAVATPLSSSFFSLPWTKPNFQAASDGSEASSASARLALPASQGPEAPSWPAVAASQPSAQWPSGSFSSVQSSPSASIDGPAALFSAALARWTSAHPSPAPLGALPPASSLDGPVAAFSASVSPSMALADPPSSSGLRRSRRILLEDLSHR